MTVLSGDLAIKQSMELIRVFKSMKDYLVDSKDLIKLFIQTNDNTNSINEIKNRMITKEELKKVMDNFIDSTNYKHFLILNGQKIEADIAYTRIYKSAKQTIYIVDNYLVIDHNTENETIYHCGAFSKDAGDKITTILTIEKVAIYHPIFDELLKKPSLDP